MPTLYTNWMNRILNSSLFCPSYLISYSNISSELKEKIWNLSIRPNTYSDIYSILKMSNMSIIRKWRITKNIVLFVCSGLVSEDLSITFQVREWLELSQQKLSLYFLRQHHSHLCQQQIYVLQEDWSRSDKLSS